MKLSQVKALMWKIRVGNEVRLGRQRIKLEKEIKKHRDISVKNQSRKLSQIKTLAYKIREEN